MKKSLLLLLAAFATLAASAQTKVEIEGIWYNLTSETQQAEVTFKGDSYDSYSGEYSGSITLPATVTYEGEAYSVTSIGEYAFRDCSSLTAITLPEGVTSIGDYAFRSCSKLTAVHISDIAAWCNIKFSTSDSNPLYYAHNLYLNGELVTELTIPESVTSIGNFAFYWCRSLTDITLPEGVTSIGKYAFDGCGNLKTVINYSDLNIQRGSGNGYVGYYADRVINVDECIDGYAFKTVDGVHYLTGYIGDDTDLVLPNDFYGENYRIGDYAFYGCSSLTSINIPESVTRIGYETFRGCSSLTAINIPENSQLTSIGEYAFRECSSLTAITLPEGVTSIGYEAFRGCTGELTVNCNIPSATSSYNGAFCESGFTKLTIGDKVTSIGDYAFSNCSSLTTITIPEGVTSIGKEAFANCEKILDVYCYAVSVPVADRSTFNDSYPEDVTLHVPMSALTNYMSTMPWKNFGNIVPLSEALPDCSSVTITINQYGSGTYCSEYALDFSNVEGLKAYAAAGYDSETGVVTLLRVMTAKAGVGLFIKGEPGEYRVPVIENTSYNSLNMLVGTLTETVVNSVSGDGLYANYKYTVAEGETEPLFHRFMDGSTLSAGKAYLQIPMAWLPTNAARSIGLRFDEGTTSIENIEPTANSQQPTAIYDLQGRRVAQPVKGVYIINGKKVVL